MNYTFRMHDPRVGRFFAVDPLSEKYPHYTPYSFSGNKVIAYGELEGLEELLVTDRFTELFDTEIQIIDQSEVLKEIVTSISDPKKADKIKVYFFPSSTVNGGFTADLIEHAKFLTKFDALSQSQKRRATSRYKNGVKKSKKMFNDIGIDYTVVSKQGENGTQIYGIGISEELDYAQENVAERTMTIFHEIIAHLKNKLDGTDKDQVQEHIEYYGLDKEENKELFKEYYDSILKGFSVRHSEVAPSSPAGEIKEEVEKAYESQKEKRGKENKIEAERFESKKKINKYEKGRNPNG